MHIFVYIFLVLLFVFLGVVAGSLIKSTRIIGNGLLFIFISFIVFGLPILMIISIGKLFIEITSSYKILLILFAVSAFVTELAIDKIFLCPHDADDIESDNAQKQYKAR